MFDLNLSFDDVPEESISVPGEPAVEKLNEFLFNQMENSGTSNSSVVNLETSSTDEHSCSDHRLDGYAFDILKSDGDRGGFVTKELFPSMNGEVGLDLSENSGESNELRIGRHKTPNQAHTPNGNKNRFSIAKQTNPTSDIPKLDKFLNAIYEWRADQQQKQEDDGLKFGVPTVVAGVLCFLAASISSAGGIGGGGLYVPILTIVAGADLKTASCFSAFMVTGGSIANVVCNMLVRSPKNGGKVLIDFDIALLSEPCMLLGVSIGVICNRVLPEWLITILFPVFLGFCTSKTCKSGFVYWKLESELENGNQELENGLLKNESCDGTDQPLLEKKEANGGIISSIPWLKMGMLVIIWFSFFSLYLLRGNQYGQGIIPMEACGVGYWIISSVQFPLAIIFTSWILYNRESQQNMPSKKQEGTSETKHRPSGKLIFPIMALLAGVLGGVFGIGGGMLISPLLIQVGINPEVTAATCSFMVFFSSTMSAMQYLLLGMKHVDVALIFAVVCWVASIIGLVVVQRAIEHHGRASLIVFSVGIVMALSTVLMTSFGTVDIWRDYTSGNYMGFKQP